MRLAVIALLMIPLSILGTPVDHASRSTPDTPERRARKHTCPGKGGKGNWARPSPANVNNAYIAEGSKAKTAPEVVNEVVNKVVVVTVTAGAEKPVQSHPKPRPTKQATPPPTPQNAAVPVAPKAPESKPSPKPAPAPQQPKPQAQSGSDGQGMSQADWIAAHTNARAKYGSGPVTWSAGAAAQAEANVANHRGSCDLSASSHTDKGKFGENLMAGSGGGGVAVANDVVNGWMSESKNYNYNNPGFAMNTGHFTAIVWKNVKGIGCAVGKCGADGTWTACCYDPFPNAEGQYAEQVPRPL